MLRTKHIVVWLIFVVALVAGPFLARCEETACRSVAQLTVEMTEIWIEQGCDDVACPGEDCEEAIICVLCEEWGSPDAAIVDEVIILKLPID